MTSRARVLWLTKGLGRGGAERLLVGCASHVAERFDVEVAYVLPWKDALVPELRNLGVPVHCLQGGLDADPRWVWRLHRMLQSGRFDLVHTHMPVPAVAARLLLTRAAVPLVHTEHNVWQRYRGVTRWANARTYHRNSAVIAVSSSVAASITDGQHRNPSDTPAVSVIVHGIERQRVLHDLSVRDTARTELGVRDGEMVIGTVGNCTAKKDQRTLLAAHRLVLDRGAPVRLVLVGSGPLESELRAQAVSLGIADRVVFAGSRDDVPRLLAAMDLFVLSSRAEGLPLALMEAMATGLPCVSTAVGGVPEIVTDGATGVLVPPGEPAALAEALLRLARDEALRVRLGSAAATRSADFDVATAQRKIEAIYDQVLTRNRSRSVA